VGLRPKTALFLFAGLVMCGAQVATGESGKSSKRIKAPAFEVKSLKGETISLAKLKGKVVFLEFWATWCPPCVMSAPQVEKMVGEYKEKNVEFVSVSVDQNESSVRRFVSRYSLTSKVALAQNSGIQERYGISGIPAFFVIDKEGYAVRMWEGYHTSYWQSWRDVINQQLKK